VYAPQMVPDSATKTSEMEIRIGLPAMAEQKRNAAGLLALLVQEMHLQLLKTIDLDRRGELWMLIQFGFLLSPVESILPVFDQSLDV